MSSETNGWTAAEQESSAVAGDKAFIKQMSELGPVEYIELGEAKPILPVFSTHYGFDSVLTLEEAGKTEPGNPVSVCDIAKEYKLQHVTIVDGRIDGFLEAYKNIQKAGISQLIYGLKLVVVSDMNDKTQDSSRGESKIIVFLKNTQAYNDVLKIWSRAWTTGHFATRDKSYGRIDWKTLKEFWTPNLSLVLPYFSSFLSKNTLTFAQIVPDLPVPANEIALFKEVDSGLPFAPLLDDAIDCFAADSSATIQQVKSVYYAKRKDFDTYMTYRAILNRAEFSKPNVDDLASDHFSFEDYVRLSNGGVS